MRHLKHKMRTNPLTYVKDMSDYTSKVAEYPDLMQRMKSLRKDNEGLTYPAQLRTPMSVDSERMREQVKEKLDRNPIEFTISRTYARRVSQLNRQEMAARRSPTAINLIINSGRVGRNKVDYEKRRVPQYLAPYRAFTIIHRIGEKLEQLFDAVVLVNDTQKKNVFCSTVLTSFRTKGVPGVKAAMLELIAQEGDNVNFVIDWANCDDRKVINYVHAVQKATDCGDAAELFIRNNGNTAMLRRKLCDQSRDCTADLFALHTLRPSQSLFVNENPPLESALRDLFNSVTALLIGGIVLI